MLRWKVFSKNINWRISTNQKQMNKLFYDSKFFNISQIICGTLTERSNKIKFYFLLLFYKIINFIFIIEKIEIICYYAIRRFSIINAVNFLCTIIYYIHQLLANQAMNEEKTVKSFFFSIWPQLLSIILNSYHFYLRIS